MNTAVYYIAAGTPPLNGDRISSGVPPSTLRHEGPHGRDGSSLGGLSEVVFIPYPCLLESPCLRNWFAERSDPQFDRGLPYVAVDG